MALRIALSGFVVLVVAMGIGRFAFTPRVPLMIAARTTHAYQRGLVATMNYLGYLVGAWDAMRPRFVGNASGWHHRCGCADAALRRRITPLLHGLLRFVIGCMSSWSMVLIAAGPTDGWGG